MIIKQNMRLALTNCIGEARLTDLKCFVHGIRSAQLSMPDLQKRIIIVGCPNYNNLGDHAIAYAQRRFIESRFGIKPILLYGPIEQYWKSLEMSIHDKDIICFQGGGNMGTLYEIYENERLAIIDRFKANKIIVFPQTISYGNTLYEQSYMKHVCNTYRKHPDLHLVARERMSLKRMKKLFSNNNVLLTPDIVLSLPALDYSNRSDRDGLCLCLRADKERKIDINVAGILSEAADGKYGRVFSTDTMHSKKLLSPEEGERAVLQKIQELAHSRLVVTDRIHGMIFCAISGTPCIAFDNATGKVGMEYEWLKEVPYIHFARSVEDAATMLKMNTFTPGRFPCELFSKLFDPLTEVIAESLN